LDIFKLIKAKTIVSLSFFKIVLYIYLFNL